jgi:hypothetical protein
MGGPHPVRSLSACVSGNARWYDDQWRGAFGAFTWGVLDRLFDEEHITFDPVSGASAGVP